MHSSHLLPIVLASAVSARYMSDDDLGLQERDLGAAGAEEFSLFARGKSAPPKSNVAFKNSGSLNLNLGGGSPPPPPLSPPPPAAAPPQLPACGKGVKGPCIARGQQKRSVDESLWARDAAADPEDALYDLYERDLDDHDLYAREADVGWDEDLADLYERDLYERDLDDLDLEPRDAEASWEDFSALSERDVDEGLFARDYDGYDELYARDAEAFTDPEADPFAEAEAQGGGSSTGGFGSATSSGADMNTMGGAGGMNGMGGGGGASSAALAQMKSAGSSGKAQQTQQKQQSSQGQNAQQRANNQKQRQDQEKQKQANVRSQQQAKVQQDQAKAQSDRAKSGQKSQGQQSPQKQAVMKAASKQQMAASQKAKGASSSPSASSASAAGGSGGGGSGSGDAGGDASMSKRHVQGRRIITRDAEPEPAYLEHIFDHVLGRRFADPEPFAEEDTIWDW